MTVAELLALTGAGVLAAGGLVAFARSARVPAYALQVAGAACLGVAGALLLCGAPGGGARFSNGVELTFGLDALTGFFLLVLALCACPALIYASAYADDPRHSRSLGVLSAGFVLSLAGVVTARSALSFLLFWELMTLIPAAAILITRKEQTARSAVFTYLAITHLGSAGVWICLLLLAGVGGIGDPGATRAAGGAVQAIVAVAAVIGFGTKAGAMPFHTWLPQAHPLAPSHFSALMSGVMVKVAIYGLIRVIFEWLGATPVWLALLLLALGALSALGGITYALFQRELKRLLAFSTIENVGIVLLGLGAALLFAANNQPLWSAMAFAAALFHVVSHALSKSLLFLGAGSLARIVHGLNINRLGGLLRRMPWTGAGFFLGGMAIAGLPPLNGFVSEWLTIESLIHLVTNTSDAVLGWLSPGASLGSISLIVSALCVAALAATAALAAFCFVKVIGLALLGPARSEECAQAHEVPRGMTVGTSLLAVLCVTLGLAPGLLFPRLIGVSGEVVAAATRTPIITPPYTWGTLAHLGVSLPGTGTLSNLGVALVLVCVVAVLRAARGRRTAAPAPVWNCGQRIVPQLAWSSAGFTKLLRLSLSTLLRPVRNVTLQSEGGVPQQLKYESEVPHLFETRLYEPVVRWALGAAARARRLQSGSVRTYMLYLLALVLLLLAAARLGVLR